MSPDSSGSPYIKSPPPHRSRSSDQAGHLVPGTLPPFTMLNSDFLAMQGESLAPHYPGLLQVRTKTRAQHAAAALSGSRLSSIKCVVDSTLQYTMPNDIPLQVHDPPPPSPASQPVDHQVSIIPALQPPAVSLQNNDQHPVPPVDDSTSCRSPNNSYVNPPFSQLVVNKGQTPSTLWRAVQQRIVWVGSNA